MPVSILLAARFSRMAYMSPADVQRAWEFQEGDAFVVGALAACETAPVFMTDVVTDTQAYLLELKPEKDGDNRRIVVVGRGTNGAIDIMADINACQVPLASRDIKCSSGVRVHEGLLFQYKALEQMLKPLLTPIMLNDAKAELLLVGHSSGAAITCIASIALGPRYPGRVTYIGFGSPRVGNAAFCNLQRNSQIVTSTVLKNGSDPIVKVFPGDEYAHICTLTHVGHSDSWPQLPLLNDMPDHDIALYEQHCNDKPIADDHHTLYQHVLSVVRTWLMKILIH